jgi:hypothetical protein
MDNKCPLVAAIRSYEKARRNLIDEFSKPVKIYPLIITYKNYSDGTINNTCKVYCFFSFIHRETALSILSEKSKNSTDVGWTLIQYKKDKIKYIQLNCEDEYYAKNLCYYASNSYINNIHNDAYLGTLEY